MKILDPFVSIVIEIDYHEVCHICCHIGVSLLINYNVMCVGWVYEYTIILVGISLYCPVYIYCTIVYACAALLLI